MTDSNRPPVLAIADLHVSIGSARSARGLLEGVSLSVAPGEMRGLVGETGSGKTMIARAVMRQLPIGARVVSGSVAVQGEDILAARPRRLRELRGRRVSMIFQNPRTALHPMLNIGRQMGNVLASHGIGANRRERADRTEEYLRLVGIGDPARVSKSYPFELSGGLAQRAVIATALSCEPELVIADEPTTGLDVTVQLEILEVLAELQARLGLALLFITHDLSIVAQYCGSVTVLRAGSVVEDGSRDSVLLDPRASYTKQLVRSSKLDDVRRIS